MFNRVIVWIKAHPVWSAIGAVFGVLVYPLLSQLYVDALAPPVEAWLVKNFGPHVGAAASWLVEHSVPLLGAAGLLLVGFVAGHIRSVAAPASERNQPWTETRLRVRRDPAGSGSFLQVMCTNVNGWQQTYSKIQFKDEQGRALQDTQHDNIAVVFERPFAHSRPILETFGHKLPGYTYFPLGTRGGLFMFTDAVEAPILDIWFPPPDHYEKTGAAAVNETPVGPSADASPSASAPLSAPQEATPQEIARSPRGMPYDAKDRQLVRDALRELNTIVWDRISPAHIKLRTAGAKAYELGRTSSPDLKPLLSEIEQDLQALADARKHLIERFINGRDDGDEAWAIMHSQDPINAVTTSGAEMISAVGSMLETTHDPAIYPLIQIRCNQHLDALNVLSAWVSDCIEGIRKRRSELGGD